jgi:histidine ammonia-lyase
MSTPSTITIGSHPLTLAQLEAIGRGRAYVDISPETFSRAARGRAVVEHVVALDQPAYGITTGVGSQKVLISAEI